MPSLVMLFQSAVVADKERLFRLKSRDKALISNYMKSKVVGGRFWMILFVLMVKTLRAQEITEAFDATTETVGPSYRGFIHNKFVTPVNQILTPAGDQIELPALRPNALALSPDHSLLVTAGLTHQLLIIGTQTGKILQRVPLPPDQLQQPAPVSAAILAPDGKAQLSFNGLTFSPDGSRIYLSNVNATSRSSPSPRASLFPLYFPSRCRWPMPPVARWKFPPASRFRGMAKNFTSP
jgi:hypothetical protein